MEYKMKQHITVEQLKELSDKAKEKLREWWKPSEGDFYSLDMECNLNCHSCSGEYHDLEYDKTFREYPSGLVEKFYPLLSIGQMIHFLSDNYNTDWSILFGRNIVLVGKQIDDYTNYQKQDNICGS